MLQPPVLLKAWIIIAGKMKITVNSFERTHSSSAFMNDGKKGH